MRGFEGTSLNRLIQRLEISKGAFYYYFDDKADLFITVVDFAWEAVVPVEKLELEGLDTDTFWPALEELMREASVRVRENPWLVGFTRYVYDPPEVPAVREALTEKFAETRQWRYDLIGRGQQLGTVRTDLPIELLQALLAGASEAGDRWFVVNWDRLEEDETDLLLAAVFAVFRRMLEPPATGTTRDPLGEEGNDS